MLTEQRTSPVERQSKSSCGVGVERNCAWEKSFDRRHDWLRAPCVGNGIHLSKKWQMPLSRSRERQPTVSISVRYAIQLGDWLTFSGAALRPVRAAPYSQ